MVRVKHRYLLVNILYPEEDTNRKPSSSLNNASQLPAVVNFRRPSSTSLTAGLLVKHIRQHIELMFGDYGAGVTGAGMTIKYFSQATSTFILRCPRAHFRIVWAALTYMTELPRLDGRNGPAASASSPADQVCVMRVVRVSGTIRKSEEEAIRRARADILKARRQESVDGPGKMSGTLGAVMNAVAGSDPGRIEDVDMDDDDEDDDDEGGE